MKSSTLTIITVGLVVLFGVGAFLISGERSENDSSASTNQTTAETRQSNPTLANEIETTQPESETMFTLAEVAEHATSDDCWTVIEGMVYDITSYISAHPGGNNILSACGNDGTALFNGEQSGQLGGRNDHSSNARAQLDRLKIGTLAE